MTQTIVVNVIIPAGTSVSLPNFCASIPERAAVGAEQAMMHEVATPLSAFISMHTKSAIAGEAISLKNAPIYTQRFEKVAFKSALAR